MTSACKFPPVRKTDDFLGKYGDSGRDVVKSREDSLGKPVLPLKVKSDWQINRREKRAIAGKSKIKKQRN